MTVFFCADLHKGHKNAFKYRKWASKEIHDEVIRDNWFRTVGKRDKVFILGDVSFSAEEWSDFATWPGAKCVVLGNHCTQYNTARDIPDSIEIHGLLKYKEFWLSHAPIHPTELRGKLNIHGHTHSFVVPDTRYLGVSVEQIGYTPISLDEVRAEYERRQKFMYSYEKFGFVPAIQNQLRQWKK